MENKRYHFLEITAQGCANCVTMGAIIQQIAQQRSDVSAESKDVSQFREETLRALKVERVPVLLLMEGEQVLGTVYGYQPLEILELWLESKIG